jgi:tyrosine-protein phosphatase YwqE
LTFLQIEIENVDSKSLINQVEYQAYDGNTTLLNLSICDDVNINMIYAIKNSSYSLIDFESANNFKKLGIDVFNIND